MRNTIPRRGVVVGMLVVALALLAPSAGAGTPTCSETLGIDTHGQHVVGDYVTGTGTDWPPSGGAVGAQASDGGAAVPGGPGPGFHFATDPPFAPGASFCTGSNSPGVHL